MRIALIDNKTKEVLIYFDGGPEAAVRYTLPDNTQISPITLGWSNDNYSVIEIEIPKESETPKELPDRVTSRQFKFRLFDMGLYDLVEGWINQQDKKTQVGFDTSSTFVKSDPMMIKGFTALGFTQQEIDDFFLEASKI